MQVLTIASGKGGVGKTTTAFELAHLLANSGRRVVALDFDPQASLTAFFGLSPPRTIVEVMTTGVPIAQVVTPTPTSNLSLIASSGSLVAAELVIASKPIRREETLRRAIMALSSTCDTLIIDTPPALGLLTLNALVAADGVLVVTTPEAASLGTLRATLDAIEQVKAEANDRLALLGVLANNVAGHLNHHREALDAMQSERLPMLGVTIPRTVALANVAALHRPITDYDRNHPAAAAFNELYGVINKWQKQKQ